MNLLTYRTLRLAAEVLVRQVGRLIKTFLPITCFVGVVSAVVGLCLGLTGCVNPVGADKATPALVYQQTHENAIGDSQPSPETLAVLRRFDQLAHFNKDPDATLRLIHDQAVASSDRRLLFALSELNYLAGERLRHGVKPWEVRDARDYYLASALYAWFFLFGDASREPLDAFDLRFRAACDLYNSGLAWSLTERRSTNALVLLKGGTRRLPIGSLELNLNTTNFPWSLTNFESFVPAQRLLVRGLGVRNRQSGLGAPLVAVAKSDPKMKMSRCLPATVLLRIDGRLQDFAHGKCVGSLEVYSAFNTRSVTIGKRAVPLETDTTASLAYALNQSLLWSLGMAQFLSFEERVPSAIYLHQPYQPGRVPVVFVHGTFSSPVWWAEMFNTLCSDPEIQKRFQFWSFVYNSGNPMAYSAVRLREALAAKIKTLDPEGKDSALQQMVVIGHSQGGLLTKLTATDTGDKILRAMLKTNSFDSLEITVEQQASLRRYTCFEALPFVKRVIFISTPHRGSYLAGSFARKLARKFVTLPSKVINASKEITGLSEKLDIPTDLRGTPTSLDSMSPRNPVILTLAEIPLAPGVKGHSIIAVQGSGDFHKGRDGLVEYKSAHVDYVESEFIVRGPHSCQGMPPTIEEVRRILHEHLSSFEPLSTPPAQ